MNGSQANAKTRRSNPPESEASDDSPDQGRQGSCPEATDVRSEDAFQVPLFARASPASVVSDNLEPGLLDSIVGEPRSHFEQLRDTADRLEGIPAELHAAGFLTASVYSEAARRNLRYAAASIVLDVRTADLDSGDDWEPEG